MIEQAFILSPDRVERLEQLNSENGQVLELLGFVRAYEDEVRRLRKSLLQIYQLRPVACGWTNEEYYEKFAECEDIAREALERTKP